MVSSVDVLAFPCDFLCFLPVVGGVVPVSSSDVFLVFFFSLLLSGVCWSVLLLLMCSLCFSFLAPLLTWDFVLVSSFDVLVFLCVFLFTPPTLVGTLLLASSFDVLVVHGFSFHSPPFAEGWLLVRSFDALAFHCVFVPPPPVVAGLLLGTSLEVLLFLVVVFFA